MFRVPELYVTTQDLKSKSHTYRLPVTDTVPADQEITAVRPAGLFRFSSSLSPESLENLKAAVPTHGIRIKHEPGLVTATEYR